MSRSLRVLGAGGHAKVVIDTARAAGFNVVAVHDDERELHGREVLGVPIVAGIGVAPSGRAAVVAIGGNRARAAVVGRTECDWVHLVHPDASVAPGATIEPGAVVFAGAVVQTGAHIGSHAIVNTGATVDHDCRIGPFVHVAPGVHLAGEVEVGEGAFIGIGSAVINRISIGAWAVVGAGAVVIESVEADSRVAGVPARPVGR